MNFLQAIILGIVEGVTEFLPISSTFHINFTAQLLGIAQSDFLNSFTIAIQLGAIIAVMILFREQLRNSPHLIKKIIISFIPVGIIGFFAYPLVKDVLLGNFWVEVIALGSGGLVFLYFARKYQTIMTEPPLENSDQEISTKNIFTLGLWQVLALIPGVSRSGAIIIGGLAHRIPMHQVVTTAFLLAIPTMISATGYDLLKTGGDFSMSEWGILLVGIIVSGMVAYVTARALIQLMKKPLALYVFGGYRLILAILLAVIGK